MSFLEFADELSTTLLIPTSPKESLYVVKALVINEMTLRIKKNNRMLLSIWYKVNCLIFFTIILNLRNYLLCI
jgi:hypothetical protein